MKALLDYTFRQVGIEMYLFWLSYFAAGWAIFAAFSLTYSTSYVYELLRGINESPLFWILLYWTSSVIAIILIHKGSKLRLMTASMIMTILWLFTTVIISWGSVYHVNTGTFIYGTFTLVSAWCYLRAGNSPFL